MSERTHSVEFVYLASQSPRRHQLLAQLGIPFEVVVADIDEKLFDGEAPGKGAERLAIAKAMEAARRVGQPDAIILAADTLVVADQHILGKPTGRDDALDMLERLSGRSHRVHTAVAIVSGTRSESVISSTEVRFRQIPADERERYWNTGEPVDKAGAYAIQGIGAAFIEQISGSYTGVMGLPLFETANLLQTFGIQTIQP